MRKLTVLYYFFEESLYITQSDAISIMEYVKEVLKRSK
jgi:hypothetical protein